MPSRGTEFSDAETGRQNPPERPYCPAETRNPKNSSQDPRRNGLFSIDHGFRRSAKLGGGDYLDQTACSPRRHRTGLRYPSRERNFLLQRPGAELASFALIAEQIPHSWRKSTDMSLTSR